MEESNAVRRRGRGTAGIVVGAAVLGVLAGTGTGWAIQRERPPTPLPPLTGAMPGRPASASPAPAPAALPAAQDRAAVYRGDLLARLVPTPAGDTEQGRQWLTVAEWAERFGEPDRKYPELVAHGYQRAASAWWRDPRGDRTIVNLIQFRDDDVLHAPEEMTSALSFALDDPALARPTSVPGTIDGMVWGSGRPFASREDGTYYRGRGLARMGNILVQVWVHSPRPVSPATVMAVVRRQLGRL